MARTRAPDHESQREQILDLAAEKFAQTSYPSTSMSDLATASGTSKARLYHYYESKEAILFDLLDRYTKRLMLIIAEVEGRASGVASASATRSPSSCARSSPSTRRRTAGTSRCSTT